jgi:hypothetical protein
MPPIPFPIQQFGGLDLLTDPTELGMAGATDLSNVAFDQPGRFRCRDGYELFASPTTAPQRVLPFTSQTSPTFSHLVTSSATKLEVFSSLTGAAITAGAVTPGFGPHAMTVYGKPGLVAVYATQQQDVGGIRKWNGTAWSVVAGSPAGQAIGVWETRLVVGGETTGSESRVSFSNAGNAEVFGANDWVDINPNDGDYITSIQTYQDKLFVFKNRRFAVFYGVSIDSTGNPIFNYREFPGIGATQGAGNSLSTSQGVYFLAGDGLYLTTGGTPVRVDGPISPLFRGSFSPVGSTATQLAWNNNQLMVGLTGNSFGTSQDVYVHYNQTDNWSKWSTHVSKTGGQFTPLGTTAWFFVNGSDNAVYKMLPSDTTDNGTGIAWNYTTGYSDAGGYFRARIISSGERKQHFKTDVLGSGTVTHQVLTLNGRPNDVADPGGAMTLGTAPAVARAERRRGARGTHFAHKLSGTGPAVVSGMTYWLANVERA